MVWRREDNPLLPLCRAQAEESETADGRLKSQRKGRGDKKKRPSAVTKAILDAISKCHQLRSSWR